MNVKEISIIVLIAEKDSYLIVRVLKLAPLNIMV
jgi:hypothetical protein